ncbi:MAG: M48 family metallopeptidase [Flavobacteriaceae bacterium]|nr:M48 family metallopeptidase [Flavobacteriaceae bacterium]
MIEINVDKREKTYFILLVIVSVLLIVPVIFMLPVLLPLSLLVLLGQGLLIGHVKGNGVRVSEVQFPEIYKIVVKQSEQLGLPDIPKVYIMESGGVLNAFATRFLGFNYVLLYSELVEVSYDKGRDVMEFVIGHELGHIKRNHINKKLWTFPAQWMPFLAQAYSRACENTCDNIGFSLNQSGAEQGILVLAVGPKLAKKINAVAFYKQQYTETGFWVWLSEKLAYHPHLSKRVRLEKDTFVIGGGLREKEEAVLEKEMEPVVNIEDYSKYLPKN